MIEGIQIKELKANADERGALMELLRSDDPIFSAFGQAYVTYNYPDVIRAWHYHRRQDDYWTVVRGMVKAVLFDDRERSATRGEVNEFFLGEQNRILIRIPAGVIHGYKTIGKETSLLLNFPTRVYNHQAPDEYRLPYDSEKVPYDWAIRMR